MIASARQLPIEIHNPKGPLHDEAVELIADLLLSITDEQFQQHQGNGNGGGKCDTACRFSKEGSGNG